MKKSWREKKLKKDHNSVSQHSILISLLGNPIAKARPRFTKSGIAYDPQKKEKEIVQFQLKREMGIALQNEPGCYLNDISCVSEVKMIFYMPIPKSDSKAQKNAKIMGIQNHNIKPDYDNLEKFYLDCGSGILWRDDKQISKASCEKIYSEEGRVEITIYWDLK